MEKKLFRYLQYVLLLVWVGGCVTGAAIPEGGIDYTSMGAMAFFIIFILEVR